MQSSIYKVLFSVSAFVASLACAWGIQSQKSAAPPGVTASQAEFFESKIRPLLVANCYSCHGPEKQLGGLRLDSRAALLKGGGRGTALNSTSPETSLILKVVSYSDSTLKMPPSGKLHDDQISALSQWLKMDAPWPEATKGTKATEGSDMWALKPIRKPALPRVQNSGWVRNPIDAFVVSKLESKGMVPAPPADKRALMRRAYFDLIGLPPSPEEVEAFLADKSPNAYENVIDRLLGSPSYGERWARYWLDLVRYADSNGYERDNEKPYSWKYRDYVIKSLNEDKAYDRFVTEQLAGDELPNRSEETVTATGFLRLGTWDDEPNDPLAYKFDRLEDLVHATSTAFLGVTLRCARCHDHKFDPIPQTDYYAIAAAFYNGYLDPGDGKLMGGPPREKLGFETIGFTDSGPKAPPIHLQKAGDPRHEAQEVRPGYLTMVSACRHAVDPPPPDAQTTHRRLQLAQWICDPMNPLTARVMVNRIWQHHFGEGLVRTPNNFGRKGSPPTHPELLDWLAAEFMKPTAVNEEVSKRVNASKSNIDPFRHLPVYSDTPWTIKRMHRMIMLSNAYRMSSVHPRQAEYERTDAGNELLWKFNRRRLDADALRDSMLAVSGRLNLKKGGPGFTPTVSREALEGLSRKGAEWMPSAPGEQRRRSIYMFLKRALIVPLLTVFDFSDTTAPLEARDVTTVAPQALALMNNPFVFEQSDSLAKCVEARAGKDAEKRIEWVWKLALGREPTARERVFAAQHVRKAIDNYQLSIVNLQLRPPPGLRLWLSADKGVNSDGAGKVTSWSDQSGSGNDAGQSATDAQPSLVTNAINGQPALRFDGKGRFLIIPKQVITSQQFTIVAVVNDRAGGGSHREVLSNWRRKDNVGPAIFLGTTGAANVRFTDFFNPAGVLEDPSKHLILTAVTGSGVSAVFQNRNPAAERAVSLPERNLMPPYVIGQQGDINGEFWNGDIAEIMVFDRALSESERAQVWNLLTKRYGIAPLPSPEERALASLCHVLLNSNEFVYVD